MSANLKKMTKPKYEIQEKRLKILVKKIVRSLDIQGLYRVQIEFPKNYETWLETQTPPVLALFFDTVFSTADIHEKEREVEQTLKGILGIDFRVVPIPYSEVKYHLRKPRNI